MTKKNDTRGSIDEVKKSILDKITELAKKGNIEDLRKFTDLLPRVQLLSNNLDEIDVKINLLRRAIQDILFPAKKSDLNLVNKLNIEDDNLTTHDKAKIKRTEFIQVLESKGIQIEPYKGVVSRIKKTQELFGIAYSGEKSGSWFLGLPQLDLKIIVLLCLQGNNDVFRVILPKDFCEKYRDYLSTSGGQYKFSVKLKNDKLYMYTKQGNVEISQYIDNYSAFI